MPAEDSRNTKKQKTSSKSKKRKIAQTLELDDESMTEFVVSDETNDG